MGPFTWTEHAPVSITLDLGLVPTRICHWRLNETLLRIPQLREELKQHIINYFQINDGSVSSSAAFGKLTRQ